MGGFEDKFAGLGRWIDDRVSSVRSGAGSSAGDRLRSMKESMGSAVRTAGEATRERIERAKHSPSLDRDDPKVQRNLLVLALVLVGIGGAGLGIWLGPRFFGGGPGLTAEERAQLDAISTKGGAMFQTAPPPPAASPESSDPASSPGRSGQPKPGGALVPSSPPR